MLREVLGPILLEANYPDIGKPYYIARSSINALAIIEPSSKTASLDNGSSVLRWWARTQLVRTFCEIPVEFIIIDHSKQPSYQRIAEKVQQLKQLGLSQHAIAIQLKVDVRTVAKSSRWSKSFDN